MLQGEAPRNARGERQKTAKIIGLLPRPGPVFVYNLEVIYAHNYHVGSSGVLVHNACGASSSPKIKRKPRDPRHHIFPQEFRDEFERLRINIDDFTQQIPQRQHNMLHNPPNGWGWNDEWGAFFNINSNPSAQDAIDFATELMGEHGLLGIPLVPFRWRDEMAHSSLGPEDDAYLSNEEIVQLLGEEFSYVESDRELGRQEYDEGLDYLRSLINKGLSPGGRDIKLELELAETKRDEALYVFIAESQDPGDAYLCTILVPEEPVFFGYSSQAHQSASQPLLQRVKRVLGYYEIE